MEKKVLNDISQVGAESVNKLYQELTRTKSTITTIKGLEYPVIQKKNLSEKPKVPTKEVSTLARGAIHDRQEQTEDVFVLTSGEYLELQDNFREEAEKEKTRIKKQLTMNFEEELKAQLEEERKKTEQLVQRATEIAQQQERVAVREEKKSQMSSEDFLSVEEARTPQESNIPIPVPMPIEETVQINEPGLKTAINYIRSRS